MTTSLPFTLPDAGFREVSGTIYLEEGFIVLELETKLFGEWDEEQKTIEIEPAALVEVRFEKKLFRDHLILRPIKRDLLKVVPGTHKEELVLKIRTRYRQDTSSLARAIQSLMMVS